MKIELSDEEYALLQKALLAGQIHYKLIAHEPALNEIHKTSADKIGDAILLLRLKITKRAEGADVLKKQLEENLKSIEDFKTQGLEVDGMAEFWKDIYGSM